MLHPNTELKFIDDNIGHGVFATAFIAAGTITWVQDKIDTFFTKKEIEALEPEKYEEVIRHCYRNRRGQYLYSQDIARYINHSFNPNCMLTAYDAEIAIRDIQAGEQLTADYGHYNIIEPFQCIPELNQSRDMVYPDDLTRMHTFWDQKLKAAFKQYLSVPQPLAYVLSNTQNQLFEKIAHDPNLMESILNCYYLEKMTVD